MGRTGPDAALLALNSDKGYLVGIDIGAARIRAEVLDFSLRSVADKQIELSLEGCGDRSGVIRTVWQTVGKALQGIKPDQILGIGFSWTGAVDHNQGIVKFAPNFPVRGDLSLQDMLMADFAEQLRGKIVTVDHDLKCLALAEKEMGGLSGEPRSESHIICVSLDQGVGVGIVTNGGILRGATNFSGEFGHFRVNAKANPRNSYECGCHKYGCLESEVSVKALERKWAERFPRRGELMPVIRSLVEQHDSDTVALFDEVGIWLGNGLSYVVNLLNPELIVFTGRIAPAFSLFYPKMREELERMTWKYGFGAVRSERSRLGQNAIAIGAAINVFHGTNLLQPSPKYGE